MEKITRIELIKIIDSKEKIVVFTMRHNLICPKFLCLTLNTGMCLKKTSYNKNGLRWKCYGRDFGKTTKIDILHNFLNSKLIIFRFKAVIYEWSRENSVLELF
jgi:hypothetical protein